MQWWYGTKDVARVLGVTVYTVRAWIHAGKLKATRGPYNKLLMKIADVEAFVRGQSRHAPGEENPQPYRPLGNMTRAEMDEMFLRMRKKGTPPHEDS